LKREPIFIFLSFAFYGKNQFLTSSFKLNISLSKASFPESHLQKYKYNKNIFFENIKAREFSSYELILSIK
jgi:hypothetical protein